MFEILGGIGLFSVIGGTLWLIGVCRQYRDGRGMVPVIIVIVYLIGIGFGFLIRYLYENCKKSSYVNNCDTYCYVQGKLVDDTPLLKPYGDCITLLGYNSYIDTPKWELKIYDFDEDRLLEEKVKEIVDFEEKLNSMTRQIMSMSNELNRYCVSPKLVEV